MKLVLKLEELMMFVLGVFVFSQLNFAWWWFLVLILAPDISMFGYLVNTKVGAVTYNLFHHKGIAILVYIIGTCFQNEIVQLFGAILFSHASFDRIFGYGLKYFDNFKHTHLGEIGN
ncbi:DUF4260 domain-containing protein [Mariniflexile litorale]|uniref:DUF4260 domain-containing protein n=1 Tax=Mariniflexile litorale TaxID=3045158 RepID=A0AAU7EK75_9FLAO|nr:DUF4260 domain-containing protein [Mariniflexile sp. KMM 9835]MDQ8212764.1 DUF4260 domain-containing protein [Mariniflexile sp. KMM 9835]